MAGAATDAANGAAFREGALERLTEIASVLTDLTGAVESGAASRDVLLDLGTSMADLVSMLDGLRSADLQGAVSQIGASLAGIAAAMERSAAKDSKVAEAIVSGIARGVSAIQLPAPVVHVQGPTARTWRFEPEYHSNGAIKAVTGKAIE